MRSEDPGWTTWQISDLIDEGALVINDGYRAKNAELGHSGLPFVRARNVGRGIQLADADCLDWKHVAQVGNKRSRPGDVVFTSKGTVGRFAFVSDETPEFVYSPQLCFWRVTCSARVSPRFLHYWMKGRECRIQFNAAKSSTDMADYVSLGDQRRMHITLPPVGEQRRVGRALGVLDKRIENNRRLAKTLEEIAATLFKARFVDFVDHDDLVESEIGPIPRDWKVRAIGDALSVVGGSTPSTKISEYWDGGNNCWATPKDLSGLEMPVLLSTARHITGAGVQRISSKLLPARTTLMSSRAPVGYTAIALMPVAVNQGFIAVPPSRQFPSEYVLFWLRENMDLIKANAGGTTFAEISKRAFRPLPMLIPPSQVLEDFRQVVEPMLDRIAQCSKENAVLAALRDSLLPRLVSGEIRFATGFSGEPLS